MEYDLLLAKPLKCAVDREGYVEGQAVFYGSYADMLAGNYASLRTGLPYADICPGLTDTDGLIIKGVDFRDMELSHRGVRLAEITVTCSNKDGQAGSGRFNFSVNVKSAVMTERYRGMTLWQNLGAPLPAEDRPLYIPYTILTLSGTYNMALPVATVTAQVNTVNMYPWDLSIYGCPGLGAVSPGCAKFVGWSYTQTANSTQEAPTCQAVFSFHLRAFDWNQKVRPAEPMRDIDGKTLYWQSRFPSLPTYTGNAAAGTAALEGTPIWPGTNTVLGGPAVLGQNAYDTELLPAPGGQWLKEFPEAVWEFAGCSSPQG
ncbi:MAG: hypothetical protein IK083_09950 [Abditibacteriota bacterium]|nr:hypothetical protein [Abditibacteriota bacterium]